jgi:hypothetical protein
MKLPAAEPGSVLAKKCRCSVLEIRNLSLPLLGEHRAVLANKQGRPRSSLFIADSAGEQRTERRRPTRHLIFLAKCARPVSR